jgi:hypothetical protein
MATEERLEYLLPCGHKSAGLACFECAVEEYLARERAVDSVEPVAAAGVPRELTMKVTHPPHIQRFGCRRKR